MKKRIYRKVALILGVVLIATSCNKKLNVVPIVGINPSNVYDNVNSISDVVAKIYGGFTLSGGSAGNCDLNPNDGSTPYDPGTSVLYRMYWYGEEMPADQVKLAWNDGNLPDLCMDTWNSSNDKLKIFYLRLFYNISVCNEFLRNLPASKVNSFSATDAATIRNYVAEVRFCRAMTYWIAMDCFGNIPFATETSSVGTTPPKQASRAQVYSYIVSELNAIQNDLLPAGSSYGRIDQGCDWFLLAKVYLNANVYTGTPHWDSAYAYTQKLINSGTYNLTTNYPNLFEIDNEATSKSEIIWPLRCNGLTSQSYGNSTFLVNAEVGNADVPSYFGISSGWAGYRATSNLINLFPNALSTSDTRAMFDSAGQTLDMTVLLNYPNGYGITKFKNVSSTGIVGSALEFCDLDIPFFRYADVLLMDAEAALRQGNSGPAITDIGLIRARANATPMATVTLDSVLAERGRELYCEGSRRTDLIRFGYFTGASYLWPWKGGVATGTSISNNFSLFPIPTVDLNSNPNLQQNAGYN